jgi:hypothetical protein
MKISERKIIYQYIRVAKYIYKHFTQLRGRMSKYPECIFLKTIQYYLSPFSSFIFQDNRSNFQNIKSTGPKEAACTMTSLAKHNKI